MFRHFPTYRYQTSLALLLTLTLSGCTDDDSQAHLDDMRAALASANAESTALRASGRVLQTRLKATQAELRQRHAQGSQRLRAAESAVAHFRGGLSAASQALSASEFRNTALSQQLAAVSGWLGQRDAVGQSQNNTLKNMEGDLQRSNASLAKLQEQFSAQQQSLHLTTAKAKKSRATNALFAAQLKAIRVQFDELNLRSAQRITALKTQQTQLSRRASNANERAQSSQNSVQRLTKINEQTELELQSLRDDLVSAQDSIGRYRSAKDYLVETIEGQETTLATLNKGFTQARNTHAITLAKMLEQQGKLKSAAQIDTSTLRQLHAQHAIMKTDKSELSAQLNQSRNENAALKQRVRGAQQAKDYLDGKLSIRIEELKTARTEHRTAIRRIEKALQLSLEESRVLEQREREVREQLSSTQQTSSKRIDELRTQLSATQNATQTLEAQIESLEGVAAYLKTRNAEQLIQLQSARDKLVKKDSTAQLAAKACSAASKAQVDRHDDMKPN